MKLLLAAVMSFGFAAVCRADVGGDDGVRTMFYFEQPLTWGAGKNEPFTFGLRVDSAPTLGGGRLPLLDWRLRERGVSRLNFAGIPVVGYTPDEAYADVPWYVWLVGGAAAACLFHVICPDSDNHSSGSSSSSAPCPTCGS